MQIPSYVSVVISTLQKHGREAFMVGGCVRDLLLGKEPVDYDVATSASIEQIKTVFPRTVPLGEKHGTVGVIIGDGLIQVSSYKTLPWGKSSVPAGIEGDLLLRDFTINAMAMDSRKVLIDPYGGQEDLHNRLLRSPQDQALERFREDPLRMMRAVRFAATLGFSIYPGILAAIGQDPQLLTAVAVERVQNELNLILVSERPALGLRLLQTTGMLQYVLPEVNAMVNFDQRNFRHDKDVFEHSLAVVEAVPPRLKLRLAALLHDVGKPCTFTVDENGVGHFYGHHTEGSRITRDILRRLRYDNQTIQDVSLLVAAHMSRFAGLRNASLIRLVKTVGEHNLDDLYDLQKADTLGSAPPFDFTALNDLQKGIARILEEKPPMHVRDLAVDGYDLMELGFAPGPAIGQTIDRLLDLVMEDGSKNEREYLLTKAREYLTKTKS